MPSETDSSNKTTSAPAPGGAKRRTLLKDFGRYLVAFLVGIVSFYMTFSSFQTDREIDAAQSWEPTPAHVEEARLRYVNANVRTHTRQQKADVRYAYVYRGTTYHSSRTGWHTDEDMERAYQALERNPNALMCYVNPERPDEAVLFRSTAKKMGGGFLLFATGFGLLLTLGGLLGMVDAVYDFKKNRAGSTDPSKALD